MKFFNFFGTLFLSGFIFLNANSTAAQTKELTAEQILNNDFEKIINDMPRVLHWTDAEHFVLGKPAGDRGMEWVLVNARTGEEQPYTPSEEAEPGVVIRYGDIYYLEGDAERRLTDTEAEENNPTLSPDGTKVAFTRNRDLYVIELESDRERRLTEDGSDIIYNGWASWVYMEEILGRSTRFKAYWWSPDSKRIAFMRFDDSPVDIFPIHAVEGSYGELVEQRYPKAGYDNPEVRIGILQVENGETTWAGFDETEDQYFGMPYWRPDAGALWVQWMNRDQNHLVIYEINLNNGRKKRIYEERQETWIDLDSGNRLQFLKDGNGFLMLSDRSGWMHLYHYDMNGKLINQITEGEWTVGAIQEVNEEEERLYFTARKKNSARFDLYKVGLDGSGLERITWGPYHHSVRVSPGGTYFVTTYGNTSTPYKIAVANHSGEELHELADTKGPEFDDYNLARTELIRVATPDGFELPVTITWPIDLDESASYPLLVSIYGGPNASSVYDRWQGLGMNQWWAKEGLIQVSIDHRGSGHFGKTGQNYMHRDLGNWEIQDYSTMVEYLVETYPFIDEDRIGITGFSYGGYVTALALTKAAGLFDYGLAGGSVTDWHLYDTHYTERYMDRPQDNPEGYKSSSVMTYVDQYEGYLLMVHGSMDDNVHIQNTLQLVSALTSAGKEFAFIPYIGGKHGWGNLPGKARHYRDERYRFYYKYLLKKPVPAILLER